MPELAGEIEVTIELKEVSVGTELQITLQAGLAERDSAGCLLSGLAGIAAPAVFAGEPRHSG